MNDEIIEIRKQIEIEEDDNFDEQYTLIQSRFIFADKNNTLSECGYLDWNFIKEEGQILFSDNSTFYSIYSIGKLFKHKIKELGFTKIDEIEITYEIKNNLTYFKEVIEKWIKLNGYPYLNDAEIFKNTWIFDGLITSFVKDCIKLNVIYDTHKWLIKIYINRLIISEAPCAADELKNLKKCVEYLGLLNHELCASLEKYIANLKQEYTTDEIIDFIQTRMEDSSKLQNIDTLTNYINCIKYLLITYVKEITNRPDFLITKQTPFKLNNSDQIRIMTSSNSIIGIAYQTLLFHLTSFTLGYKREICHARNCNNEFIKISNRQKYCQNEACQRYRNNKKSKHWYDKNQKKI